MRPRRRLHYGVTVGGELVSWHPVAAGTVRRRMGRVLTLVPLPGAVRVYFERDSSKRSVLVVPSGRWHDPAS